MFPNMVSASPFAISSIVWMYGNTNFTSLYAAIVGDTVTFPLMSMNTLSLLLMSYMPFKYLYAARIMFVQDMALSYVMPWCITKVGAFA